MSGLFVYLVYGNPIRDGTKSITFTGGCPFNPNPLFLGAAAPLKSTFATLYCCIVVCMYVCMYCKSLYNKYIYTFNYKQKIF